MEKLSGMIDICSIEKGFNWHEASFAALSGGIVNLLEVVDLPSGHNTESGAVSASFKNETVSEEYRYEPVFSITGENVRSISEWESYAKFISLDLTESKWVDKRQRMNVMSYVFNHWSKEKPILIRGNADSIGTALFFSQIHESRIHICGVTTLPQLELIREAKMTGTKVTCDVIPAALFLCQEDIRHLSPEIPESLQTLGTEDDRKGIWQNLSLIDCFSCGILPSKKNNNVNSFSGLRNSYSLLLNASAKGTLNMEKDIIPRCYQNPLKIFGLHMDENTYVTTETEESGLKNEHIFISNVVIKGKVLYHKGNTTVNGAETAQKA